MPLPTDPENAQQAKERANERSTKSFDLVGILCPANDPVTICEPNSNELIHDEDDGDYDNDRAASEFSPADLHEADPENPWDVIYIVPERVEFNDGHKLRVNAYKYDHSMEAYQTWQRELEDVERRPSENQGLGDFA